MIWLTHKEKLFMKGDGELFSKVDMVCFLAVYVKDKANISYLSLWG